jgi:hypothetical protein
MFLLLGVILLVLGGSIGIYALDEASENNGITVGFLKFDEPIEEQIHEAITHDHAHAVATAYAVAVTATATAEQHPFPKNGPVALDDPLTHNTQRYQWSNGYQSDSSASCTFSNEGYHVVESNPRRFYYCIARGTDFGNFAFQVQMTFVSGKFGGLIFRSQEKQHYYFSIGLTNKTYNLQKFSDDIGTTARSLATGSSMAIFNHPDHPNLLAVVARGDNIDLFVNKQYITSVQDSGSGHGEIGLAAEDEGGPAEIVFSNARVWAL